MLIFSNEKSVKWAWLQHPTKKHMLALLMPSVMSCLPDSDKPPARAGRLCLKAHFFFATHLFCSRRQTSGTSAWLLCKTWAPREQHPRHRLSSERTWHRRQPPPATGFWHHQLFLQPAHYTCSQSLGPQPLQRNVQPLSRSAKLLLVKNTCPARALGTEMQTGKHPWPQWLLSKSNLLEGERIYLC